MSAPCYRLVMESVLTDTFDPVVALGCETPKISREHTVYMRSVALLDLRTFSSSY